MNVGPDTVFQMPPLYQYVGRTADKERQGGGLKLLFLYRVYARIGVNQAGSASPEWYLKAIMSAGQSTRFVVAALHRYGARRQSGARFIKRGMNHYNWVTGMERWGHGRNSRHLNFGGCGNRRRNRHG